MHVEVEQFLHSSNSDISKVHGTIAYVSILNYVSLGDAKRTLMLITNDSFALSEHN